MTHLSISDETRVRCFLVHHENMKNIKIVAYLNSVNWLKTKKKNLITFLVALYAKLDNQPGKRVKYPEGDKKGPSQGLIVRTASSLNLALPVFERLLIRSLNALNI